MESACAIRRDPSHVRMCGPNLPTGTELGRGFIDYHPIFAAAGAAGVQYYFSEHRNRRSPTCPS